MELAAFLRLATLGVGLHAASSAQAEDGGLIAQMARLTERFEALEASNATLRQRVDALEAIRSEAIIASPRDCDALGMGWTRFDDAEGRFLLGAGGEYPEKGGSAKVSLSLSQLPRHQHEYWDVFHSEAWTHDRQQSRSENPRRMGSKGGTDFDNNGFQKKRTTGTAGRGLPHENMPPYTTIHFCIFAG